MVYNEREHNQLICGPHLKFQDGDMWLMKFGITKLSDASNLLLYFTESPCNKVGISVNFEYFLKIYVSDSRTKSNFKSVEVPNNINGTNILLLNEIWILYWNGVLRIGFGEEISTEYELIS